MMEQTEQDIAAGRQALSDMTDRELLEEVAANMRNTYDLFADMTQAVQQHGILGLLKAFNGKN